jgi:opacity protein-like surface antigen
MFGKALLIGACIASCPVASFAETKTGERQATAQAPLVLADAAVTATTSTTPPVSLSTQLKGFYITGALGGNWPQTVNAKSLDSQYPPYGYQEFHNSGVSIEAGAGYDFGALRLEATYAYDASSVTSYSDYQGLTNYTSPGQTAKNSALASLYWDIDLKSRFTPYIGAGIGYSTLNTQATSDGLADYDAYYGNAFGYQFKLGMSYLLNRRSDIFAEAVYRGMAPFSMYDGSSWYQYGNYNSMGFQLGARVRLGGTR